MRKLLDRLTEGARRQCRDAWRGLCCSPAFSLTAVGLLAVGIGSNIAVFTVVNAVLFRPLAVRAPNDLVFISRSDATRQNRSLAGYDDVHRFLSNRDLFTNGTVVDIDQANLRVGTDVDAATGERVSADYFEVLGVRPSLGRTLASSIDGAPSADRVIVISDALWRRRFHADPSAIGLRVSLGTTLLTSDDSPLYTIVGVVPPEFTGVSDRWAPTEYWVEFTKREHDVFGVLQNRTVKVAMAVARLRRGVTLDKVRAAAGASLPSDSFEVRPESAQSELQGLVVSRSPRALLPFGDGTLAPSAIGGGLMLVVGLVLAICVTNLAGLMATRAMARQRDASIRLALGATRGQLARQQLGEMTLLVVAGGLVGAVLSRALVNALLSQLALGFGGASARLTSVAAPLDRHVLVYMVASCVLILIAIGLVSVRPLRSAGALDVSQRARLAAPTLGYSRRQRWILVPQLAVSLALLLGALTATKVLLGVVLVPSGYEPQRAAYATFEGAFQNPIGKSAAEKEAHDVRLVDFPSRVLSLADADPGLDAVAIARALPIQPRRADVVTRHEYAPAGPPIQTETTWVTADYFRAMGIPIRQGRVFSDSEVSHGEPVSVVDEALATRLWPGQSALGKSIATHIAGDLSTFKWYTVVGVVGAIRGPRSHGETFAFAYLPWPQRAISEFVLIGRGRGTDRQLFDSLRSLARTADARFGVIKTQMVSEVIDERRYAFRLVAELLGLCAIGGLTLAATGLYGTISYAVAKRQRELGIRAALGAQPLTLVMSVVNDVAAVMLLGAVVGLPIALICLRVASRYVLPVPTVDVTIAAVTLLVAGLVALLAGYVPARRAARADPLDVLRLP